MLVVLICGAFSSKYDRYAAFGQAVKHAHDVLQQAPMRNKLKQSVVSYEPSVVQAGRRFQLTLTVTEEWPTSFHFRIDQDKVFDGYLDSQKRPTATITGLKKGGRLLYVSFDEGETWMYLGQIKVEGGIPWVPITLVLIVITTLFMRKALSRVLRRMLRRHGIKCPACLPK